MDAHAQKISLTTSRKQDLIVQKFGLRLFHKLDAIQAEAPFLLLDQEDGKRRVQSRINEK